MKRIPKLAGLTLCALAAAGLALALQLPQGASAQAQACSLETLQGDYIYSYDGVTVADGQQTPYAYAGRENYDGQGGMTGVYSGSYGGEAARSVGYTGTYTLEADCSGTLATVDDVSGDVLNFDLFLDPETGDFFFTATDAGEVSQGLNRKTR